MAADFSLLTLLVGVAGTHYLFGATAGFAGGTLVAFGLSVAWVFPSRSFTSLTAGFAAFTAVGLLSLVVSLAAMRAGIKWFHADYRFVKCSAAVISFLLNFFARRTFLFSGPPRKREMP